MGVERGVGERASLKHDRDGVGRAGGLGGEQLGDERRPKVARGVVPAAQDRFALGLIENVQAADDAVRLGERRQQKQKPVAIAFEIGRAVQRWIDIEVDPSGSPSARS